MLEFVRGTLIRKDEDSAVVEAGGIGFLLLVPTSTYLVLPEEGSEALLYTHLTVNAQEGEFAVFGFATELEREVFRIFIGISGIGPRKGLMILSQVRIEEFAAAVRDRNLAYLSQIKGIGKKTAERLLVELREKMLPYATAAGAAGARAAAGEGEAGGEGIALPPGENIRDAVAGLVALGVRYAVAARAITKAVETLGPDANTGELVKLGLKHR